MPSPLHVLARTLLNSVGESYLLRDELTTAAAAPVGTRGAEPGPGTATFSAGASISGGKAVIPAGENVAWTPISVARVSGYGIGYRVDSAGVSHYNMGFRTAFDQIKLNGSIYIYGENAEGALSVGDITGAQDNVFWMLANGSAGIYYFVNGELRWVNLASTGNPSPVVSTNANSCNVQWVKAKLFGGAFATQNGIATLDVASPSGSYTGTADQILHITLTAPGTITTEAGIRFRVLDANNYNRAYFGTSGEFKLDKVVAGTPTNLINVAAVISAGQTRKIIVTMKGTSIQASTVSGIVPTRRGADLTEGNQSTQTTVATDIGAGWSAANLRSFPRNSVIYTAAGLDQSA